MTGINFFPDYLQVTEMSHHIINTYDFKNRQQVICDLHNITPDAEQVLDYIISIWDYHKTTTVRLYSVLLKVVVGRKYNKIMQVLLAHKVMKVVSKPVDGVMATGYQLNIFKKEKEKKHNSYIAILLDESKVYKQKGLAECKQALIEKYKDWVKDITLDISTVDIGKYAPAQKKAIKDILQKIIWLKQDDFSGRIHTSITMLPKEIRKKIKIDGEETTEVDIKSSFCQKLFHLSYIFNTDKNFKAQVERGDVYKYVAYHLGVDRQKAKELFNLTLNAKDGGFRHNGILKLFPELFKEVDRLKFIYGHKIISQILQRAELNDIIRVSTELAGMGIKHFTIHDCILCKVSDAEKVKQMLLAHNLKSNVK